MCIIFFKNISLVQAPSVAPFSPPGRGPHDHYTTTTLPIQAGSYRKIYFNVSLGLYLLLCAIPVRLCATPLQHEFAQQRKSSTTLQKTLFHYGSIFHRYSNMNLHCRNCFSVLQSYPPISREYCAFHEIRNRLYQMSPAHRKHPHDEAYSDMKSFLQCVEQRLTLCRRTIVQICGR